jgi:hypothetical protein
VRDIDVEGLVMIDQHGTNGTAGLWLPESFTPAPGAERGITLSEEDARQVAYGFELLQERLAELEVSLQFEDIGWQRLGTEGETEFSPQFLKRIRGLSRLMFLKNPLISRAVSLQAFYVFGQGIQIAARHPDVNAVVQAFLDDRQNKAEITSQQARTMKEKTLQIEGNIFFVFFTNKTTGRVRVRSIPTDEIADIVTNPDDAREPWYYKRSWTPRPLSVETGVGVGHLQTAYYPDWRYQPAQKIPTINGSTVQWDTPVYHIKVGGLDGMRYGVPETYAAQDWARAYKAFLEDWATITRAYARFAWKLTTPGGSRAVAAAKTRLSTTVGTGDVGERNPPPVTGSTFIAGTSGTDMTPIRTAGATTSSADGEHLKLMVAAAFGVPSTFFGDANVGNHATAKTLDRPTELKFVDRQTLWEDVHQDILSYVIDQAALAPRGKLTGARAHEPGDEDDPRVVLANDPDTGEPMDRVVVIDFPPILEHDQASAISAIVEAATLGGKTPSTFSAKLTTRLLLQVLGIEDIDEVLATLFPEPPEDGADPNAEPPNEDDLSPSSSQAPKPTPPSPPAQQSPPSGQPTADGTVPPEQQQQQPAQEAKRAPSSVTAADLGAPLPLADVDLDDLSRVGPEDMAGAGRLWKEANAGEPTAGLINAETDEGE